MIRTTKKSNRYFWYYFIRIVKVIYRSISLILKTDFKSKSKSIQRDKA